MFLTIREAKNGHVRSRHGVVGRVENAGGPVRFAEYGTRPATGAANPLEGQTLFLTELRIRWHAWICVGLLPT